MSNSGRESTRGIQRVFKPPQWGTPKGFHRDPQKGAGGLSGEKSSVHLGREQRGN